MQTPFLNIYIYMYYLIHPENVNNIRGLSHKKGTTMY